MQFDQDRLRIGNLYTRPQLAQLWGYASHEAIGRGVVTPSGTKTIILFVTHQKQERLTQYVDFISGNYLHWEGEKAHGNDERIMNTSKSKDEIYLFYRDIHHTPFRYYGRIRVLNYIAQKSKPSEFVFELEHDLGAEDDIKLAEFQLHEIDNTERTTLIRARLGQGKFREDLFQLWHGCSVTEVRHPDLLRASHIKPWRVSENKERLNPYNGLLLLPQYDHLFDHGYITFDNKGTIQTSQALSTIPVDKLGINLNARLKRVHDETKFFLEYHRKEVFLNSVAGE